MLTRDAPYSQVMVRRQPRGQCRGCCRTFRFPSMVPSTARLTAGLDEGRVILIPRMMMLPCRLRAWGARAWRIRGYWTRAYLRARNDPGKFVAWVPGVESEERVWCTDLMSKEGVARRGLWFLIYVLGSFVFFPPLVLVVSRAWSC